MSTTPITIPPEARTERYHCNKCDETFERTYPRPKGSVCTINHVKGCCHFGDTIVTKRQLQKELELQQTVKEERQETTSDNSPE